MKSMINIHKKIYINKMTLKVKFKAFFCTFGQFYGKSIIGVMLQHQIKKGKGKLHSQLTAEQREAIKSKVSQMKEAEATSKEIKQTVDQMMLDFGVNPAQRKDKGRGKG